MDENDKRNNSDDAGKSGSAGAARLRDDIDRGAAGDKVAFSDPAASPLGTDDEAGGHPPTAEQVQHARKQETRAEASDAKRTAGERHNGSQRRRFGGAAVAVALGACILILVFLFF